MKGLFGMECGKEAVPAWSVSLGIRLAPYDDTFEGICWNLDTGGFFNG